MLIAIMLAAAAATPSPVSITLGHLAEQEQVQIGIPLDQWNALRSQGGMSIEESMAAVAREKAAAGETRYTPSLTPASQPPPVRVRDNRPFPTRPQRVADERTPFPTAPRPVSSGGRYDGITNIAQIDPNWREKLPRPVRVNMRRPRLSRVGRMVMRSCGRYTCRVR